MVAGRLSREQVGDQAAGDRRQGETHRGVPGGQHQVLELGWAADERKAVGSAWAEAGPKLEHTRGAEPG
jgi:hypothetical protein